MVLTEVRTATSFLKLRLTSSSCTLSTQFLATCVSVFLLVFFSTVITTNLLIGNPIECTKTPSSELTQEFVHAYCWNENTFSVVRLQEEKLKGLVPYPGVGPNYGYGRKDSLQVHVYYQWVPLILVIQALLIASPQILWKQMEKNHINSLATVLGNSSLIINELKCRCSTVAKYILASQRSRGAMKYFYWFWFCSLLQILIFVLVFWTTDVFLGGKFSWLGPRGLAYWRFEGRVDPFYTLFPRLAKCNVEHYGSSGSLQKTDFLCFLSASLWHSRVFFVLWWWYVVALILSCLGLLTATIMICPKARIYYISSPLLSNEEHKKCMAKSITYFTIHDCLILHFLKQSLEPMCYAQLLSLMLDITYTPTINTLTIIDTDNIREFSDHPEHSGNLKVSDLKEKT